MRYTIIEEVLVDLVGHDVDARFNRYLCERLKLFW